uniref:Uncharacterized protein TCIL3000_8_3090 n=1 Tax=Trypanosoma congolense (strain IL3000) TaxID=1068625 RepID=G0URS8_TRYCI|nr:unnamed protein product [Trypanosoma congolense IL3000]
MSPQQFYDEGRDYYSSEYDDKVKNDDDDEEQVPWHVLYSSRCSKTDSFFTAESPTLRPLLTSSQENSLSDLSTVTQFTHDFFDRELSLGMAISIPPNAGYGVYNGGDHSNSPKEFIGLTEALESGQRVFFEELIAHMEFWSARGEPRRVYYDPAVLNAEQGESVPFSGDVSGNELDRSGDFCTPMVDETRGKDPATNTIPLKLLLTRVGAAQFQPQGDTLYCDPRGRELLFRALNEATELVICAARESRSHRGWHDHKQCKSCEEPAGRGRKGCRARKQRCNDTAKGTATLSAKIRNSISMTCYTNVAVEVLIHWAQGEVDKDEEDDDCSVTQAESIENHTAYPRNNRSRGSRLSAREQQQRKLERLRMEFRLANSSRLDALLIDGRNAKPLASLILVPSTTNSQHGGSPLKIVSDTKFVVQTFSHYVGQLLRHIKEEKMIMVDMDRTLVDNAIVTNSDIAKGLFNASSRVVRAVRVVRPNATKEDPTLLQDGIERHCEAFQHVSYFMKDDPSHKMRTEMIFVRRGVRRLLRQLTVEWGIPLVVVTKSSFRRTEAILKQLFDPRQELFPTVDQHVYAAEFVVQSSISAGTSINNLTLALSGSDSDQTCGVGQQDEPEWNNFQRCLLRSKKSARNVLRAWDQRNNLGKRSGSPQRARSVAVLDDMPHLWERSDWPRTVAIAPYTLNRVDPVGYFSSGGLITSLLLSTLYSRKSMVCPVEVCGSTLDREEVSGGVVDGEALETGPEVVSRGCGQMDDLDAFEGEAVEAWPDDSSYLSEISDGELMEASGVRIRLVTPDFSDAECLGCAPDELNSTVVIEEEL